jgi:hypothetical protein
MKNVVHQLKCFRNLWLYWYRVSLDLNSWLGLANLTCPCVCITTVFSGVSLLLSGTRNLGYECHNQPYKLVQMTIIKLV